MVFRKIISVSSITHVFSERSQINWLILNYFAGALIGYDKVRVFKQLYALQYKDIVLKIIELQTSNKRFR